MLPLENGEPIRAVLRKLPGAVVATSGGVDSAVVLRLARDELGDRVVAVTITGPIYCTADLSEAKALAQSLGVRYHEFPGTQLNDPRFLANTPYRCYHCKTSLFDQLKKAAAAWGLAALVDGTNADDAGTYRPGLRAAAEAGVVSPLLEAGLTKKEVRALARKLGLDNWDRPSESCLATRIPYGVPITKARLNQIRAGEEFLRRLGYTKVRLRHHESLARIEVDPSQLLRLVTTPHRELVFKKLHSLGFKFVTSDLAGYQPGCFD